MLRNSGDENFVLIWELMDKIEEVKGKFRGNPFDEAKNEN
jgi:hypothetical protein